MITVEQLRAAFVRWETEVRADRGAFQSDAEQREKPIDEAADRFVETILSYVDGERQQ